MKKIIPFKKDIQFKNNIFEIVSISLEHTLHHENEYLITGDFIISGEYKMTDVSINTENFNYKIPFDINIDEKYNTDKVVIDIDDFYYEVINSNTLLINIEVMIDKLEEKEPSLERISLTDILTDTKEDINDYITNSTKEISELIEEHTESINDLIDEHKEEIKEEITENIEEIKDLKDSIKENVDNYIEEKKEDVINKINEISDYITYRIYILKDEDNIDTVLSKYNVTRELLEQYNNLNDLKIGDKLIIPTSE